MEQPPLNQRLSFLSNALADSARAFGLEIGENTTNTHKYINGDTRPSPEFLGKVLLRFRNINARWLLTGEGEAFGPEMSAKADSSVSNNKKITHSLVVGRVAGNATQNQGASANEAALQREIELLKAQLVDKERMIQILLTK